MSTIKIFISIFLVCMATVSNSSQGVEEDGGIRINVEALGRFTYHFAHLPIHIAMELEPENAFLVTKEKGGSTKFTPPRLNGMQKLILDKHLGDKSHLVQRFFDLDDTKKKVITDKTSHEPYFGKVYFSLPGVVCEDTCIEICKRICIEVCEGTHIEFDEPGFEFSVVAVVREETIDGNIVLGKLDSPIVFPDSLFVVARPRTDSSRKPFEKDKDSFLPQEWTIIDSPQTTALTDEQRRNCERMLNQKRGFFVSKSDRIEPITDVPKMDFLFQISLKYDIALRISHVEKQRFHGRIDEENRPVITGSEQDPVIEAFRQRQSNN